MGNNNILDQLKDIHLPNKVSIFPLAIGWYITALIIVVIIGLLTWYFIRLNRHKQKIENIYQLLDEIESTNNNDALMQTTILLKRITVTQFPEENPHTLFDENWLAFLDKTGKTTEFTQGIGRDLLMIYQSMPITKPDEFFALMRKWMKTVLELSPKHGLKKDPS